MRYKDTRDRDLAAGPGAGPRDLLARRASLCGLPAHRAVGYRNRRFVIIRDAAWITLYWARLPFPQVGVFIRCAGVVGRRSSRWLMAPVRKSSALRAEIGPEATMEWGAAHHPRMTDIAAILVALLQLCMLRGQSRPTV